jgi:hypothetical protein
LDQLPAAQREAFVLCQVEELTSAEAAILAGTPEATMRTRLFHARRRLRESPLWGTCRMKSQDQLIDEGAAALRELTAGLSDGRATRARLLVEVAGRRHRRRGVRRLAFMLSIPLLIVGSASAAFTLGGLWRQGSTLTITSIEGSTPSGRAVSPTMTAGADIEPPADRVEPSRLDGDAYYGRAHRIHFVEDSPARALEAWDSYLRRYPHGAFVPEARFNRALCLIRLGQGVRAAEALQPFALGRFRGYRRKEACLLLESLRGKPAPGCQIEVR